MIFYHFCKTLRVVAVAEAGPGYLIHINLQYIIYDIYISSIKHDLARSCFQLWPKIGDKGDKISREKNWRGASRDSFFSKFCLPRSRF